MALLSAAGLFCGCRTAGTRVGVGVGVSPIPGVSIGVGVSRPWARRDKLGPELLRNGSFEEGGGPGAPEPGREGAMWVDRAGVAAHWETVCGGPHPEIYSLDQRVRKAGKRSQRMESASYLFDESAGACYHMDGGMRVHHPVEGVRLGSQALAQTLPRGSVFPGRVYRVTAYVRADGVTDEWGWFRVGVYWLDAEGEFISEARQPREMGWTGTHRWRRIEFDVQAPARVDTAKMYLHHHFERGTVWFDSCSFRQLLR